MASKALVMRAGIQVMVIESDTPQTLWRGGLPPFDCEAVAKPVFAVYL